ncbi:MAG: cyclase family protein [Anaerolineales bacterium]
MGKIIDVSMDIHPGMLVWEGDDEVELRRTEKMEDGAHANVSRIRCSVHTGTHVDAPLHFIDGGESVDRIPLAVLIGPAWVADIPARRHISAEYLEKAGIPGGTERLLMKTRNSRFLDTQTQFRSDFTGLNESGAQWILSKGIRLVGNDYLSVASRDQTGPVHRLLLEAGVVLVEGISLREVPAGACRFYCLPLKLAGSDGAPARAAIELE